MKYIKISTGAITMITLALLVALGMFIRIVIPYSFVFTDQGINFMGPDAYYHMRLVDNLLHHFPQSITFDPFTAFPDGNSINWPPLFDWLLAGIIWLFSFGSPSPDFIDTVGAYFPAILGVLTIIPVYFLGKCLFNRWVGLLAGALVAVAPGQFISRSILGYTDHHVLEVLLTTALMLFLVLALKAARQDELKPAAGWRDCVRNKRLWLYSGLAGACLGMFLLTWEGGLLIVLLLFIFFIVQFIIDSWRGQPTEYLGIIGSGSFLIASLIVLILLPRTHTMSLYKVALPVVMLAPAALAVLFGFMAKKAVKRIFFPATILGLGLIGFLSLYIISPATLDSMINQLARVFNVQGIASTIGEMRPLFFPSSSFTLSYVWDAFAASFIFGLIGAVILIVYLVKNNEPGKMLLLVSFLVMFAVTLTQVRFAHYLTIELALLTAYLSWEVLLFFGFIKTPGEKTAPIQELKKKKRERRGKVRERRLLMSTGITLTLLVTVLPSAVMSFLEVPLLKSLAIPDYWYNSLIWLKDNSPEPFGSSEYYYETYDTGSGYKYPDSAYGVMSWWSYGHWITRIAHRTPVANPFQQGAATASSFFTAQNSESANGLADSLKLKYVVVDAKTATEQFSALYDFIGKSNREFYDVYYEKRDGRLSPVLYYYPEYYKSTIIHLYRFDGKQIETQSTTVITWEDNVSNNGTQYKLITNTQTFTNYKDAVDYVSAHASNNRIAGTDPAISPVPLDELDGFTLVYQSGESLTIQGYGSVIPLKIFEYSKTP